MNSCLICCQHATHKVKYESKHLPMPQRPFDGICLDCIGPLERSSRGLKWILTCIDLHSSFLLAILMKSRSADNVIHSYIESIPPRIGSSKYILMNNGMEFKNDMMREVQNINLPQYILHYISQLIYRSVKTCFCVSCEKNVLLGHIKGKRNHVDHKYG